MAPDSPLLARDIPAHEIALPSELLLIAESQWIFTEAELSRTPTVLDGVSEQKERENRAKGVNFILQVGIMLKLPQITLSTASVFLHRFYMRHSMVENVGDRTGFHYYPIAATCLFLATKVEENCRKMRELVIACVKVAQKDPSKVVDEQDREYWRWKDNILLYEDRLMEALCFDFSLEPPYKTLFELLLRFNVEDNKRLRNAAWAFINDSCMTVMCLLFPSRTIAAGALYAAAKHCEVTFQDDEHGRPWWVIAGVDLAEMRRACNFLADIYEPTQALRARNSSISYERSSEDLNTGTEKTRAVREGIEVSPHHDGEDLNGHHRWNAPGAEVVARSGNRKLDESDNLVAGHDNGSIANNINGTMDRALVEETNGTSKTGQSLHQIPRGDSLEDRNDGGGLVSPRMDDVSEEGEVED